MMIKLTEREDEIIKLIAAGYTSREIARKLCCSEHTVNNHRTNIMVKTGATNIVQAAVILTKGES